MNGVVDVGLNNPALPREMRDERLVRTKIPRNEGSDQVVTAFNRITDVLESLAERQGSKPVN